MRHGVEGGRPGSSASSRIPQWEARRVRGSWRDYLDPAGACHVSTTDLEDYDDGEEEEEDAVVNSGDFEPFSDTCGECEGESDMEGLDLTLFEPAPPAPEEESPGDPCCPRCCMQCVREALMERPGMLPATLYVLTPFDITDKELQIGHRPANAVKDEKVPLVSWEPYFCVLLQDEQTLTAYRSEELSIFPGTPCRPRSHIKIGDSLFVDLPRVRLDGGAKAFRQRWGYELSPLHL